jgi:anti-sigma regulatory factor (Ser/Thr protein kinase)
MHLAGDLALVAGIRRTLRSTLRDWGVTELVEDMELIAGELVGNAVRHGADAGVGVLLVAQDDLLLLEVSDDAAGYPAEREPEDEDENGRGLLIVRALAKDYGWRPNDRGGTIVWATMRLSTTTRSAP